MKSLAQVECEFEMVCPLFQCRGSVPIVVEIGIPS
jgi:hypothetical protein